MWTLTHLITMIPTFVVFFGIAFLVGFLLRGKSEIIRSIPLQIIAAILIIMEVIKQTRSFGENGYDLYSLPFHFCSLFLYILPLHAFYRFKPRPIIDSLTVMLTASLFFNMLVMPANIYGEGAILDMFKSFSSFHTVVFHNLVVLYMMLTISLKAYKMNLKRDVIVSVIFLAAYVIIATVLSYSLKTNFHNLYQCNVEFIWNFVLKLKEKIGWIIQAAYVFVLFIATLIFGLGSYFAIFGLDKLVSFISGKCKKKTPTTV